MRAGERTMGNTWRQHTRVKPTWHFAGRETAGAGGTVSVTELSSDRDLPKIRRTAAHGQYGHYFRITPDDPGAAPNSLSAMAITIFEMGCSTMDVSATAPRKHPVKTRVTTSLRSVPTAMGRLIPSRL